MVDTGKMRFGFVVGMVALAACAQAAPQQDSARVKEIAAMLREAPGFAEMRLSNRAAWDALAGNPASKSVIGYAANIIAKPIEQLDDSIYTNQDVEVWGPINGRRARSILPLAFAECLENKGRFLPNLIERLDLMAAQTTWMNPYHDRPHFGNFYGKYRTIDLNTSENALNVAIVLDLLKDKIPEKTVAAVTAAAWKHCFEPYLRAAENRKSETYPCNGWFFGDSNWNPACHYQSVGAALFMIPDRETRAKFVEAAERATPFYLNGLSEEGYCQEGLDYWNYGFGQYLKLGLIVRHATDGKVDLFALPRAKAGCLYAHEFMLATDCAPQYGDGTASSASKNNLALCERVWPETTCSATDNVTPFGGLEFCLLTTFGKAAARPAQTAPYRLPLRTLFTDAQIYIGRPAAPGLYTLACGIKGGHNGVPHNHNDAGQVIIALGGTQMVQDPSGKKYDFDTFGPRRYNSPMLNSYGHGVPYPAGQLQKPGKAFGAKIRSKDFSADRDVFELDLRGAYPADANLKTLTRRLTYDRRNASVELCDRVTFASPSAFESPISTFGKVEKGAREGTFTIVRESKQGVKRLDFTVDCGGAKWHVKEEKIPNPGREEPTRFAIVLDEQTTDAVVTFRFTPGEMPPDIDWTLGLEGGDPAKGPWTTNFFSVANQKLATEKIGANTWKLSCDRLVNGRLTAKVGVTLEVERTGGKTVVTGRIANHEKGTRVFSFDGPFTAERYAVVDGKTNFLYPWSNGTLIRKFPAADEKAKAYGYLFRKRADGIWAQDETKVPEYPSRRCMMQWYTATDGDRGLYFAAKDTQFRAKHARLEFDAEKRTLRFGFEHRLYAHCGETYELPPTEFVRYEGDWHVAARDYGAWFAKARPYAFVPDKVKDCSTLMLLLCKQQNGDIVWPYKDFDKLGDAALKYGIRHIKILARGPGGHDNRYPDYYPDPEQGGTNALMKGLAELKKRGIETYAYVNGQLIECGTTEYWNRGGGSAAGVLQRDGKRAHEAWLKYTDKPAHEFDVACPYDKTWLDKMMEVTKEAQYLGFNGMYFDQVAKQWPWQCWATNHGHRPGDWVWTEDRARYLKGIHDELVKRDPEFILTSEGYNETVSDSCSIHLGLGDSSPIVQRFDPNATYYKFPEMAFYTIPLLRTSDRYPSPHRSRAGINETAIAGYAADIEVRYPCDRRAFENCENVTKKDYGTIYYPPIDFDPLDKADLKADRDYFKAVNDFRYANREILLRGRYEDTDGFTVDTSATKWMAKRWTALDGKTFGVLVWNEDDAPARFEVKADGRLLGASEPEAGAVDAVTSVPPHALRLWRYAVR